MHRWRSHWILTGFFWFGHRLLSSSCIQCVYDPKRHSMFCFGKAFCHIFSPCLSCVTQLMWIGGHNQWSRTEGWALSVNVTIPVNVRQSGLNSKCSCCFFFFPASSWYFSTWQQLVAVYFNSISIRHSFVIVFEWVIPTFFFFQRKCPE